MLLLPYDRFILKSRLTEDEIMSRLTDSMEPWQTLRWGSSNSKEYEGEIDGLEFKLKRIIGYRNSFLPRIFGEIIRSKDSMRIEIKMRMHFFVQIFMIIWIGFTGFFTFSYWLSFNGELVIDVFFLISNLLPFFGYGLTMVGYVPERNRSKNHLMKLFEAVEELN